MNNLDCLSDCMKSIPMNENGVMNNVTLCKYYLVHFCDLAKKHLPNINHEAKDIVDVLKRMQCQSHNEKDRTMISNLSEIHFSKNNCDNNHMTEKDEKAIFY